MRESFLELDGQGVGTLPGRALEKTLLVCAAFIGLFVLGQNALALYQKGSLKDWVLLGAWAAVIAVGLWGLSKVRWSAKRLLVCVVILCGALRFLYILLVPTPPESDFELIYEAAVKAAAGDFSWAGAHSGYFYNWGYQIPYVLYLAALWKLVPSIWALKVVGLVWMVGIDYLIYRLGCHLFSERAAVAAAALYAVYPASIHMAALLTNQHISVFFLLLGLVLLLEGRSWPRLLAAGTCLGFGNMMRSEGVLLLAALLAVAVCLWVRRPGWKNALTLLRGFALLLAAYFALFAGAGLALKAAGIAPYGIGSRRPEWKLVLGLDRNGNGGYREEDAYLLQIEDDGERKTEAGRIIADSIRTQGIAPGFFVEKSRLMWASEEPFFWSLQFLDFSGEILPGITGLSVQHRLEVVEKAVYLLVWAALPLSCLFLWRERSGGGCAVVLLLLLCAVYCAYLLVEIQPRYRYLAMPVLFILAGLVMDRTLYRTKPKLEA